MKILFIPCQSDTNQSWAWKKLFNPHFSVFISSPAIKHLPILPLLFNPRKVTLWHISYGNIKSLPLVRITFQETKGNASPAVVVVSVDQLHNTDKRGILWVSLLRECWPSLTRCSATIYSLRTFETFHKMHYILWHCAANSAADESCLLSLSLQRGLWWTHGFYRSFVQIYWNLCRP